VGTKDKSESSKASPVLWPKPSVQRPDCQTSKDPREGGHGNENVLDRIHGCAARDLLLRLPNGPGAQLRGRASLTEPAVPLTAGGPARMVAPTAADSKTITARSRQLQHRVGQRLTVPRIQAESDFGDRVRS
jgi:hypothetical protein